MATLAGQTITRAELSIPEYGMAWADIEIDQPVALSGRVEFVLDDFSAQLDVMTGGPADGFARYDLRGCAALLRSIGARSYESSFGVRLHSVLKDLARDAGLRAVSGQGDVLAGDLVLPDDRTLGAFYARPAAEWAAIELGALTAKRWWVDTAGAVRIGTRPTGAISAPARISYRNQSHAVIQLGTDSPAAFVPGLTFEGIKVARTIYRISPKDYLVEVRS